jgi:hypothetical protein
MKLKEPGVLRIEVMAKMKGRTDQRLGRALVATTSKRINASRRWKGNAGQELTESTGERTVTVVGQLMLKIILSGMQYITPATGGGLVQTVSGAHRLPVFDGPAFQQHFASGTP